MGGGPLLGMGGGLIPPPSDVSSDLLKALESLLQQNRENEARALVDRQIKVLSATFDKAVAYTNLIIIAGYGGFFGLWALTKDYRTSREAGYAALCMLGSASIFVGFEVYKMIVATVMLHKRGAILQDPKVKSDPRELGKKLDDYEREFEWWNTSIIRAWWIHLIGAVGLALIGVGLLYLSLVRGLL